MESNNSLVMDNAKSWVFQLLVKSPEDSIGLIAYSFYKLEKNQYAENCVLMVNPIGKLISR